MRIAVGPVLLLLAAGGGCRFDATAVESDGETDSGTNSGVNAYNNAFCDWAIRCAAERGPIVADREACERFMEDQSNCIFAWLALAELTCGPFETCAPFGPDGAPCAWPSHCESRFCDGATGLCSGSPICG